MKISQKYSRFGLGSFPLFLVACALSLASSAPASELARDSKPNVIIILADDIGYGDLGCYGAKLIKTPKNQGGRQGGDVDQFC